MDVWLSSGTRHRASSSLRHGASELPRASTVMCGASRHAARIYVADFVSRQRQAKFTCTLAAALRYSIDSVVFHYEAQGWRGRPLVACSRLPLEVVFWIWTPTMHFLLTARVHVCRSVSARST